jgi:hypothetical protein
MSKKEQIVRSVDVPKLKERRLLNGTQFAPHIKFTPADTGIGIHRISLHSFHPDDENSIALGDMEWRANKRSSLSGEILHLDVDKPVQRHGIANAMFHNARQIAREQGLAEPTHSDSRSPSGDAWAKQTGMPLPELNPKFKQA